MSLALLATASTDRPSAPPVPPSVSGRKTPARHTSPTTLAGRLNRDWAQLVAAPVAAAALRRWALTCPALTGLSTLDDVLSLIADADATGRDAVLLALVEAAQAGDALAGRTVLQTMLGKAVQAAGTVARRDDVRGDQEEALARAVAALWQAIATYPVALRPARVAANLALDTVAVAQRGHTGSSHFRRSYRELPVADVGSVGFGVQHDGGPDDMGGPADAQLLTVLAWAVRAGVLDLDDAQLLVRVYSVDEQGRPADGRAVAGQAGLSWPALRQRCRRLAQRIGAAAVEAGVGGAEQPTGHLNAGRRLIRGLDRIHVTPAGCKVAAHAGRSRIAPSWGERGAWEAGAWKACGTGLTRRFVDRPGQPQPAVRPENLREPRRARGALDC